MFRVFHIRTDGFLYQLFVTNAIRDLFLTVTSTNGALLEVETLFYSVFFAKELTEHLSSIFL